MIRKLLIATLVAGSLGSITLPASAAVVVVREAPPAPRAERVPAPRQGYSWINGHWEWRNNHHVWVRGNWVRDRRGYHYNQPAWAERDGRWEMTRGSWKRGARDNDGDGVPNRADSRPNNPNRN
jgi:hypothetical protein